MTAAADYICGEFGSDIGLYYFCGFFMDACVCKFSSQTHTHTHIPTNLYKVR